MSYKKVGGFHIIKLGRFGFQFYISKPKPRPKTAPKPLLVLPYEVTAR